MTPEHKRGYKAERSGNYYQLTITSFEEENQGFYYCIVHRNQELYYSSGLEVYRQVQLTPTPTIPKQVSTRSKGLVTEKGMGSPSSETQSLIKCELYIWVPLASGSLVLIILVIILSVCCGKNFLLVLSDGWVWEVGSGGSIKLDVNGLIYRLSSQGHHIIIFSILFHNEQGSLSAEHAHFLLP
uniref:Uncharacterized protein n=1 Tax=Varanus komodoensis TaxID=61221 RepID=A0A8D2LQU9_VARKO